MITPRGDRFQDARSGEELLQRSKGAEGASVGGTPKQRLADAFAGNFDDSLILLEKLGDLGQTRRWVGEVLCGGSDGEVAKGVLAVGGRQLRNALA